MGTQALCAVLLLAHSAAAAVRLGGMACGPARFHATALALTAIVATAFALGAVAGAIR